MDARKIQFLIGIQREIDKLEAKDGNTPKVERVKSRFYDVVEVDEIVSTSSQAKQDTDKEVKLLTSVPSEATDEVNAKIQPQSFTPEQVKENQAWLEQLKIDVGLAGSPLLVARRKNPIGVKKEITLTNEEVAETKEILPDIRKDLSGTKIKAIHIGKGDEAEQKKTFPHKPKDVAAFLNRFRDKDNRGLKYLTHDWSDASRDNPLRYKEVMRNAISEFWECVEQYKLPPILFSKLIEFIVTKSSEIINKEGKNEIRPYFYYYIIKNGKRESVNVFAGWSGDEMIEWVKKNPDSDPNCDDYWIDKLINPFKNIIEIRRGMLDQYFRDHISFVYGENSKKFSPIFSKSLKAARFFTDVPTVFEGIKQLLDCAKKYAKEQEKDPYLNIFYESPETDDTEFGLRRITIITDLDPELPYDKKFLTSGGNFGKAYNNFRGLCNWSILCKQEENYCRINLLNDVEVPDKEILTQQEVEGFTHVLTFYGQ